MSSILVRNEGRDGEDNLCLSLREVRFVLVEEEAADCLYSIVW